jgi:hypothetical protein
MTASPIHSRRVALVTSDIGRRGFRLQAADEILLVYLRVKHLSGADSSNVTGKHLTSIPESVAMRPEAWRRSSHFARPVMRAGATES